MNPYYRYKSHAPKWFSLFLLSVIGIWILYFSFMMNFVTIGDCYALQNATTGVWTHTGNVDLIVKKDYSQIINMSYKFRLVCVLGVTVWSQFGFCAVA